MVAHLFHFFDICKKRKWHGGKLHGQLSARHKKNRLSHDIRFSKTNYLKTNLLKQIKKSSLLLASLINWWQNYNKKLLSQNFFVFFFLKNTNILKYVTFVAPKRAKRQRFVHT